MHHVWTRWTVYNGLEKTPLYHKLMCRVSLGYRLGNIYNVRVQALRTIHAGHVGPMFRVGWIFRGLYISSLVVLVLLC